MGEAGCHPVFRLSDDPEEHDVPKERETGREKDPTDEESEQPRRLPRVRRKTWIRQQGKDANRHRADDHDPDCTERGNEEACEIRPPSRFRRLKGADHEPIHLAFRTHAGRPEDVTRSGTYRIAGAGPPNKSELPA